MAFGLTAPIAQLVPKQAQAADQTAFTCAPGYVYSQQSNGKVYSTAGGTTLSGWSSLGSFNSVNGIGIGADGSSAYAYERTSSSRDISAILQYTPSTGWTKIANSSYTTGLNSSLVTGAVDLLTGNYLFGGYNTVLLGQGQQSTSFKLFEYVVASHAFLRLGSFTVDNITSNGDMAFDAAGNLYVVQSGSQTNIYSVTADNVKSAESAQSANHQIPATKVSSLQGSSTVISNVNGIAFDSDGTIYLGNGSTLSRYDPTTWKQIGSNQNIPGGSSTDLASCNSPSTLTIRKNLPNGRALTNDQFTLSAAEGTTPLSSTTTTGNASGIQDVELGPMPVVANDIYSFSEAMASGSGSALNGYTSTWSCTDVNNAVVSSGTGSSGSVKIPSVTGKGAAVTCTITNVPVSNGSVTWSKVDENNAPLAGSTWSLVGPTNGTSTTRTVTDCVAKDASGCADSLDKDPAGGKFSLTGLMWGNYDLTETAAPSGYQLDSTTHSFTIDGSATVNVGSFKNVSIPKATVIIKKVVQKVDGTQIPGAGWKMSSSLAAGSPADIAMSGNTTSTTNATGIVTDPWTITFGNADESASINVGETQQTGYRFLSGSCVTSLNGTSTTTNLDGTSASSNLVQGITSGSSVVCTFINEEQPGSVSWSKTAENGAPLAGSEWTITGPGTGSSASKIVVKDCVAVGQCAGTNDTDPTPGSFNVTNLEWGDYSIQETQAPAGYVTDSSTSHDFTISADSLAPSFTVPITNRQQSMPSLPLTGGQSIDSYLIGGSLIMILSLGIGYAMHRRRAGSVR
ncbi:MAG: hypothetical protein LKJ47_02800 [Bifidobacteriaceae bacterium]|nr:hypothetical protein [Bifidobacteriaceae bacterium]